MALQTKAEYMDLNGKECREILAARFWQFLETIPEMQERFALTRVRLRLEVAIDVWGASPPRKIVHDNLEITTTAQHPSSFASEEGHHSTIEEVNVRQGDNSLPSTDTPPDLIREEHSLPVHRGQRNPQTGFMETVPVILEGSSPKYAPAPKPHELPPPPANQASPTVKKVGKRTYAGWVEQDKGAYVTGERTEELPVGGDKFMSTVVSQSRGNVVMPQPDFLAADYRGRTPDPAHLSERVERSGQILQDAEQQFNRAPDAAQLWSMNEEGKGKE